MFVINNPFSMTSDVGFETITSLAHYAFEATERLTELNTSSARSLLENTVSNTRALMNVKTPEDLLSFPSELSKPLISQSLDYTRDFCDITFKNNEELLALLDREMVSFKKNFSSSFDKFMKASPLNSDVSAAASKSLIAVTNSVCESMAKTAQQLSDMANANHAAIASSVSETRSKKAA